MKIYTVLLAFFLSFTAALSSAQDVVKDSAQENPADQQELSDAQLEQILSPIALYPDSVLTHVLIASTYPLEVIKAQRWRSDNPDSAVTDLPEESQWDPSVTALLQFPNILERLSSDLDWMQNLGDAFLQNEERVLDSIQSLRQQADAADSFDNIENMRVSRDDGIIVIEPAQPEIVYLPYYDTRVVYGSWRWNRYPPIHWDHNWHHEDRYSNSHHSIFSWHPGVHLSSSFFFGGFLWRDHHTVVVDRRHHSYNYYDSHHRRHELLSSNYATRWHHNPSHRRGVHYRNNTVTRRFQEHSSDRRHHQQRRENHYSKNDSNNHEKNYSHQRNNHSAKHQSVKHTASALAAAKNRIEQKAHRAKSHNKAATIKRNHRKEKAVIHREKSNRPHKSITASKTNSAQAYKRNTAKDSAHRASTISGPKHHNRVKASASTYKSKQKIAKAPRKVTANAYSEKRSTNKNNTNRDRKRDRKQADGRRHH